MFEINFDSSIIISLLIEDTHFDDATKALYKLEDLGSQPYMSLITYTVT